MEQQEKKELSFKYKVTDYTLFCVEVLNSIPSRIRAQETTFTKNCYEFTANIKVEGRLAVDVFFDLADGLLAVYKTHRWFLFNRRERLVFEKKVDLYNIDGTLKQINNLFSRKREVSRR